MSKTNDRWSALSMKDRAELINIYVKSGITDLGEIRKDYNSFSDGGDTEPLYYDNTYIEPAVVTAYSTPPIIKALKDYNNYKFIDNLVERNKDRYKNRSKSKSIATELIPIIVGNSLINNFDIGGPINTDYKVVNNIANRDYWFDTPTGKLEYDKAFNDYKKYYNDFFNSLKGTEYNNIYEKYQNLNTPTNIQSFIAEENNYKLFSKFKSYKDKLAFSFPDFVSAEKLYNRFSDRDESLIPSDFNLESYKNSINAQGDQVVDYINSLYNTSRGKRQLRKADRYAIRKGANANSLGVNNIYSIKYYPKDVDTSKYSRLFGGNASGIIEMGTIDNVNYNFRNTLAHELGHGRNLYNTPGKESLDSPYYGFNYGYIRNRHKKWLSPTTKVNDHDVELAESYSDLMALRYDLYDNNIVDGTKRRYRNKDIKNFLNTEEGQKNRYLQQHTNINHVRKALNRVYDVGGVIPPTLPNAMYNPIPEIDPKEELYVKTVPNPPLRPINDNFSFKNITEDIANSKGYLYNNRDYYRYYKDIDNKYYLHNTRYNRDTGVINPDNFTEVPYEEIRGMLGARDYIGGSKRDVGLKVLNKLTGINEYITQLSNTYGISNDVFKQRLINEGLLQMIAEDYNNMGPNEQKSYSWQDWIDNEINGYHSLGLDTFGSHLNKGDLNLRRNIDWHPMEIQNEDGTNNTYTSASFNNLYDALEAKAAMLEYFTNIGKQRGLSGTDLDYWVNAAYNMGEYNEKLNNMDYVRQQYSFDPYLKNGGKINKSETGGPKGEGTATYNHPRYNNKEEAAIYQYLIDQGVPHTQAVAIMGNIAVESMLDPKISQIGGGGGYGLIQATDQPRKNNFINYDGQPYEFGSKLDPETQRQLDYIIDKGLNTYTIGEWRKVGKSGARNVRKEFLKETDVIKASNLFTKGYLRPGKPHTKRRQSMSAFYNEKYTNPFENEYNNTLLFK